MPPPPAWRTLAQRLPHLARRARLLAETRGFFAQRGYQEVETPCLVPCPGMEPHLDVFETTYVPKLGEGTERVFLHTSPEFAMKKLLAGGLGRCFQLARVWRNGEVSSRHVPEFTMLEFYAPGMSFSGLMDETEAYLCAVLGLAPGFERLTMAQAFARHAAVPDLLALADDAPALAREAGVALRPNETWQDLFFRLLLERVEPARALQREGDELEHGRHLDGWRRSGLRIGVTRLPLRGDARLPRPARHRRPYQPVSAELRRDPDRQPDPFGRDQLHRHGERLLRPR
jgi:lysyl-tRNA synthetase class 2